MSTPRRIPLIHSAELPRPADILERFAKLNGETAVIEEIRLWLESTTCHDTPERLRVAVAKFCDDNRAP